MFLQELSPDDKNWKKFTNEYKDELAINLIKQVHSDGKETYKDKSNPLRSMLMASLEDIISSSSKTENQDVSAQKVEEAFDTSSDTAY